MATLCPVRPRFRVGIAGADGAVAAAPALAAKTGCANNPAAIEPPALRNARRSAASLWFDLIRFMSSFWNRARRGRFQKDDMKRMRSNHKLAADRRAFLKAGGSIAAGLLAQPVLAANAGAAATAPSAPAMPTRNLGRTGHKVAIFSLGGQAALERANNEAVAVQIVELALDLGVNYIDTSSIYGGKERWSERYIGQVMKGRRSETFLASKTKERTRDESLRRLDESLKLLATDHLDLWQLHDIGVREDVEAVFGKGGAMEALVRARDQKIVRYLGVTGHYRPDALIEAIRRFPFDTILMAVNAADPHHFSFQEQLLPLAV